MPRVRARRLVRARACRPFLPQSFLSFFLKKQRVGNVFGSEGEGMLEAWR